MYQDCIQDYYLSPGSRGSLQNLEVVPLEALGTAGDMFKVTIRAVGLNFRDVLNVLGMYPGDPGPPGGDCAGIVSSPTGLQGRGGFEIGEAVYGIVSGCLGNAVVAPAETLAPMSPSWKSSGTSRVT